jgi:hypothetical protein
MAQPVREEQCVRALLSTSVPRIRRMCDAGAPLGDIVAIAVLL